MMLWEKVAVQKGMDGAKTITYSASGCRFEIESRKRAIPHANGEGVWYHTTFFVIDTATGFEREYRSLTDAKAAAEAFQTSENRGGDPE